MPKGIYLAFTDCTDPARVEEFNRWYSHTHLPDLSASQGFVAARRYVSLDPAATPSTYLAAYEFNSPDLRASVLDLRRIAYAAMDTGRHIECISGAGGYLYQEIDPQSLAPLERLDYPRAVPPALRAPR